MSIVSLQNELNIFNDVSVVVVSVVVVVVVVVVSVAPVVTFKGWTLMRVHKKAKMEK